MKKSTLKAFAVVAALALPVAHAQDNNNDVATTNATTADNKGATDTATDLGWFGLAGLLGLAGLAGRRYVQHTTATGTHTQVR